MPFIVLKKDITQLYILLFLVTFILRFDGGKYYVSINITSSPGNGRTTDLRFEKKDNGGKASTMDCLYTEEEIESVYNVFKRKYVDSESLPKAKSIIRNLVMYVCAIIIGLRAGDLCSLRWKTVFDEEWNIKSKKDLGTGRCSSTWAPSLQESDTERQKVFRALPETEKPVRYPREKFPWVRQLFQNRSRCDFYAHERYHMRMHS